MAAFEMDIPKASTPSPSSVPKIPLGAVGNPGMERFGQSMEATANTGAATAALWGEIQHRTMQQNAYTAASNAMMNLRKADYANVDQLQADALEDPKKLPTFAADQIKHIEDEIGRQGETIPKDPYAQHHWTTSTNQYLHQRMDELRMMQTNMLVAETETTAKRMLSTHESEISSANTLAELDAVSDTQALSDFKDYQKAAVRNRVLSSSKAKDNETAALGNFQRIRFNRMLELDPMVAGVQFRQNGMVRTEDLLDVIQKPEQQEGFGTLASEEQNKLRGAYKARVASVLKSFIYGGKANQQTVLAAQDQVHFEDKDFTDLMNTATSQANHVFQAAEHRVAEEKRASEKLYSEQVPKLWNKLFSHNLATPDLETAEKAGLFAQHPDAYHALAQAMKSQYQEDQGVNAEASLPMFLQTKLAIQANAASPDVQPEKWIGSKMSLGQKSELYTVLRLWQDKLEKNPKLHTDEFNNAKDHLQTITGGKTATYTGSDESMRMLKLQGQVIHTLALDVAGGMPVDKAFKKGREYVEVHNKTIAKPTLRQIPPGYIPPTNEQIDQLYPHPDDPRRYDAIEERKKYEDILAEQERQKQLKDSQEEAAREAEQNSFWNKYTPF